MAVRAARFSSLVCLAACAAALAAMWAAKPVFHAVCAVVMGVRSAAVSPSAARMALA